MDPLPHLVPPPLDYRAIPSSPESPKLAQAIATGLELTAPFLLLGAPSDVGIPTRPGARYGPKAIREQLASLGIWTTTAALPIDRPLIHDLGDVAVNTTDAYATHERLQTILAAAMREAPAAIPIVLGGDHSLTAPAFMAVQAQQRAQLGLIIFDAHYDVREWDRTHLSSGTPFRRILELGPGAIAGRNVVYLGIRPFANSPHYHDWVSEQGCTLISAREIRTRGIASVMADALRIASEGTEGLYCSVDIDAIDQGDAPGASATGPGGISGSDLLEAMLLIGGSGRCRGLDVMEVSPPLDHQDMTARLAAHAIGHFVAAMCEAGHVR